MPIPTFEAIMFPLLNCIRDGNIHINKNVEKELAATFNLSEKERSEILQSGKQTRFNNRFGWAVVYLKKAGLITSDKRGTCKITEKGLNVLKENPDKIDVSYLKQFQEFNQFLSKISKKDEEETANIITDKNPEELLEDNYNIIHSTLADELIEKVKSCSPEFFERLVIDLIVGMGYGGSRQDAGKAVGKKGDGGIDGIIKEDRLGLDTIYLQAKKWEAPVPVKEVRDFSGALTGKGANKGIFITTSQFSKDAYDFVNSVRTQKIILIDGDKLVNMMLEYGIGVAVEKTYRISKIDNDYFEE